MHGAVSVVFALLLLEDVMGADAVFKCKHVFAFWMRKVRVKRNVLSKQWQVFSLNGKCKFCWRASKDLTSKCQHNLTRTI